MRRFIDTWDDGANFLDNHQFRGLEPPQLRWAWRATLLGVYQPLAWLLFSALTAILALALNLAFSLFD